MREGEGGLRPPGTYTTREICAEIATGGLDTMSAEVCDYTSGTTERPSAEYPLTVQET